MKPEDGCSYEEIAVMLWGDSKKEFAKEGEGTGEELKTLPNEYLKGNMYLEKIDRLLYVLQIIVFAFGFNRAIETSAQEPQVSLVVHVVPMKTKLKKDNDSVEVEKEVQMVFNAANNLDYKWQALKRSDLVIN